VAVNPTEPLAVLTESRLPLRPPAPQPDRTLIVSVPIDTDRTLHEVDVRIPMDDTVHKGWISLPTIIKKAQPMQRLCFLVMNPSHIL